MNDCTWYSFGTLIEAVPCNCRACHGSYKLNSEKKKKEVLRRGQFCNKEKGDGRGGEKKRE